MTNAMPTPRLQQLKATAEQGVVGKFALRYVWRFLA